MSRIFAVVTAAGTITRTSDNKVYSHAIVVNEWPVTWASRLDLAQKQLGQYPGGSIVAAVELDKAPVDPYKGIEITEYTNTDSEGRRGRGYMVYDGVTSYYKGGNLDSWSTTEEGTRTYEKKLTGYLDRIWILYKFYSWKEKHDQQAREAAAKSAKDRAAHEIEAGVLVPVGGVNFNKSKGKYEVKASNHGKRYFGGWYKKENLEAANQAATAIKEAPADKAQEVAETWRVIRQTRGL